MANNFEYLGNVRGPQGYSVESAAVISDELMMTLSDGSTLDAGNVRGAQGLPGVNAVDNDAAVAGYISTTGTSATKTALGKGYRRGLSVKEFGAVGDGTTDDTAAFTTALATAAGRLVWVPDGNYVLSGVSSSVPVSIRLDSGATLTHKAAAASDMFLFTGSRFTIRGGSIDGNKANQTGRPNIISGSLESGKYLSVTGVDFVNTVRSAVSLSTFGGHAVVEGCTFNGQAQHDGTLGNQTTIVYIGSGQAAVKGQLRFNNNVAIFTDTVLQAGSNPGGVFMAANGYTAGAPGTVGFADGNLSSLEAVGNYFYGYGQNCAGNDISPLHTYPAVGGARIIGNYFEACGFCAISAKSVQDFICTNNVIMNGVYSAQNVASEGAISYAPGYQASTLSRPRAVISNNIINAPGGESIASKQVGIAVRGLTDSHATGVIIADNVIKGTGAGISSNYADNVTISGNTITPASDGTAGIEHGILINNHFGVMKIDNNIITTANGMGIQAIVGCATARFDVNDNMFEHSAGGYYAAILRGMAYLKLSGNTFNATAGVALSVDQDAASNKIGWLAHDQSNTYQAGAAVFAYAGITKASGMLQYTGSPVGVVTPAAIGTFFLQTNGTTSIGILWVATGTTSSTWAKATLV